jgi:Tfp pilus assembly protein FimT
MTAGLRTRTGTTLMELCVSVAIVALAASMVTFVARRMEFPSPVNPHVQITNARHTALATAQPVVITVMRNDTTYVVTALPNGRVLADTSFHLDELTGTHHDEHHHQPQTNAH